MEKSKLRDLHHLELLQPVLNDIINWDFARRQGVGLFKKMVRYGHIALRIERSDDKEHSILWTVSEEQIPFDLRSDVEKYLSFFINYLCATKGYLEHGLRFEIYDGSYSLDSRHHDFGVATCYALRHCFDPAFFIPDDRQLQMIAKARDFGASQARSRAKEFDPAAIYASLTDLELRRTISRRLPAAKVPTVAAMLEGGHIGQAVTVLIRGISAADMQQLIAKNVFSKYEDLTDIGLALVAATVGNESILKRLGVTHMDELRDHYPALKANGISDTSGAEAERHTLKPWWAFWK